MANEESPRIPESEPKLRHEFVGMMFAITIGEVGLQVAALVQAKHYLHFLPAYTHLLVATVMIATSWVGWSLSRSPGARIDVTAIFQWEFFVLLLDVALVITYFILVRTVDFGKESRIDPPSTLASCFLAIFILYFVWDVITKICIYLRKKQGSWFRVYGVRMIPTVLCLLLVALIKYATVNADPPHYLTADVAFLAVVLLFRALKDLVSALVPKEAGGKIDLPKAKCSGIWTAVCLIGLTFGLLATYRSWTWPIPDYVRNEIQTSMRVENIGMN